jgi:hypothetical protein
MVVVVDDVEAAVLVDSLRNNRLPTWVYSVSSSTKHHVGITLTIVRAN